VLRCTHPAKKHEEDYDPCATPCAAGDFKRGTESATPWRYWREACKGAALSHLVNIVFAALGGFKWCLAARHQKQKASGSKAREVVKREVVKGSRNHRSEE